LIEEQTATWNCGAELTSSRSNYFSFHLFCMVLSHREHRERLLGAGATVGNTGVEGVCP